MQSIQEHALYRHFKGKLYYVVGEAREVSHDKFDEKVVYHPLYGERKLFTRDKDDFFADVSDHKDNVTGQKYRFEWIEDL